MPPRPRTIRLKFSNRPHGEFDKPAGAKDIVQIHVKPGEIRAIPLGRVIAERGVVVPFVRPPEADKRLKPEFVDELHGVLNLDNMGDVLQVHFTDQSKFGTGLTVGTGKNRRMKYTFTASPTLTPIESGAHLVFGANARYNVEKSGGKTELVYAGYRVGKGEKVSGWFLKATQPKKRPAMFFLPHVAITVHDK